MNLVAKILYIVNEVMQLVSLVICADILGILCKAKIKKNRLALSMVVNVTLAVLIIFLFNAPDDSIGFLTAILYYFGYILTIYIMTGHIDHKIIYLLTLLDLSVSLAETSMSSITANIINRDPNNISPFVMLPIQIAVLTIVLLAGRKNNTQRNKSALAMIPRHIFIMLMSATVCLSALSSLISFPTNDGIRKDNILNAIVIILTLILLCIVVSLFLNIIAKQHFTAVSQMMEKQVELQISHYEELEKMGAEMSRFRHDYTNHLRSILSLIQMKEYAQAEEYIEKLQKVKYVSSTVMFYTGNKLADAILADKSSALGDNCRIEYSGIIPSSIENVDLCVILSNALDNAGEACREFTSPCVISISAGERQGYFVLSIKNPTMCSYNFYDIPPTTKAEKEQHGMGLYNIESTVKKYNGQMKVKCENKVFELIITMKM